MNSTFYGRWKQSFLDVLGKYSLQSHVLSDAVSPHSPSWVRMNCVVRTWLLGAISDDLADTISERDASARVIWLAIESQSGFTLPVGTGPVRSGSGLGRYQTGPNSKFKFKFKKMKNSQKNS